MLTVIGAAPQQAHAKLEYPAPESGLAWRTPHPHPGLDRGDQALELADAQGFPAGEDCINKRVGQNRGSVPVGMITVLDIGN